MTHTTLLHPWYGRTHRVIDLPVWQGCAAGQQARDWVLHSEPSIRPTGIVLERVLLA